MPVAAHAQEAAPPAPAKPPSVGELQVSGYVQGQYESHQDSQNQLRQDGALLNQNRFVLRRARVTAERTWDYSELKLQVDGNTVNGPTFGFRTAEASVFYRGDAAPGAPPWVKATLGLFDTPFGYELVESPRDRHFMERTIASRALWPGEPDVGVRVTGGIKFFRYAFAVLNGEPLDEKTGYPGRSPHSQKDVVMRLGFDDRPFAPIRLSGGVSVMRGQGFHAGKSATKNGLTWNDANEDGQLQPNELSTVPGVAATPSQLFDRWAVGADLQIRVDTRVRPERSSPGT
jgi:hypothetical protein